jgi:probable phosphoglycerate mutase
LDHPAAEGFGQIKSALEKIAARHDGETVAIVTHGLVLDCAYRAASGLALEAQRLVPPVNGSLNWFVCGRGKWSAGRWGDADHLGDAGITVFADGTA